MRTVLITSGLPSIAFLTFVRTRSTTLLRVSRSAAPVEAPGGRPALPVPVPVPVSVTATCGPFPRFCREGRERPTSRAGGALRATYAPFPAGASDSTHHGLVADRQVPPVVAPSVTDTYTEPEWFECG